MPLQTLSKDGKPKQKRVANADDASTICQSLIWAGRDRARFRAKGQGMVDGNPPYNAAALRAQAQAYRTNINWMEGDATVSAALVPFYDLFAGAQYYCEVNLDLDNPDDAQQKSDIATEEFDGMLKEYTDFEFNMNSILFDLVAWGKGFAMWPNTWGWHFNYISDGRVFVPDAQKASIDKLEVICIAESMQLHDLWRDIEDRKTATEVGFNVNACALAIRDAQPEDQSNNTNSTLCYEYIQQRMKDRDLTESMAKQATVQLRHLFVKELGGEYSGKITHMIVREDSEGTSDKNLAGEFLFEKQGKYESFQQALSGFFFETLKGSWNGTTGLIQRIFAPTEIKNRINCTIVDNGFLSGGITMQAQDANSKVKAGVVQFGNVNLLPAGFNVQPGTIFVNNQGLINVAQLLDGVMTSNTGIYKAQLNKPKGNPRTAKEVEINNQNATALSNSGVSRFYRYLDLFYSEIYRRVTTGNPIDADSSEEAKSVRKFRERCKKRGVTLEYLKKVRWVRAYRNIGNGSQFQRNQILESFAPLAEMIPPAGRENWLRDVAASRFGARAAERYLPQDKKDTPDDQQALAIMENAVMKDGSPVAWTPTQNNVSHATEHLKAMGAAASSLQPAQGQQSGADPNVVLFFMEIAGPHAAIHLEKIKGDPSKKKEYMEFSKAFKQLSGFADNLHKHLSDEAQKKQEEAQAQQAAAAQAQQIQQGQDTESQIKIAKFKLDAEIKQQKAALHNKIKADSARQNLVIRDVTTAQSLRLEHAKGRMKVLNGSH